MAENVIPEQYQTQNLILLVGSNPLPNYVAGELLCPTGQIFLIHSEDTRPYAEKLSETFGLNRCPPKNHRNLGKEESSPQAIYRKVSELLTEIPTDETVGLHYTGGTKVMSVHAYEAARESQRKVICSYLDARTLSMVFTGTNGNTDISIRLDYQLSIELEQLVNLHRNRLQHHPKYEPTPLKDVIHQFVQMYQLKENGHAWWGWCEDNLDAKDFAIVRFPEEGEIQQITNAFIRTGAQGTLGDIANHFGFKKAKHFKEWLKGEWLEDYVLSILLELKQELPGFGKPAWDIKTDIFQFDVAVTRGYQLFAFSCTTADDKGLCKSKLFEAYIRAQQLGGDEAKTALVCCYDDPQKLEQDLEQEFMALEKIKVFGRADLPDLKEKMKHWFTQVNAAQRRV